MSPSLSASISLFPLRLAGVATGAAVGFLLVAFFGQDRIPFLVAMSAVSFIVGIGTSSPSYGPFFLLGGIAIPAVAIFGYANFLQAGPIAFYRFAASALGVLVFTVSHLVIWPGYSPPPASPTPPPARPLVEDTRFLFGIPLRRWLSGARLAIGVALALILWFELRPPGAYIEALIACVLLTICSSMPQPRILYALGGSMMRLGRGLLRRLSRMGCAPAGARDASLDRHSGPVPFRTGSDCRSTLRAFWCVRQRHVPGRPESFPRHADLRHQDRHFQVPRHSYRRYL